MPENYKKEEIKSFDHGSTEKPYAKNIMQYDIHSLKDDIEDYMIMLRHSQICSIRRTLGKLHNVKPRHIDFLLAGSSTCLGGLITTIAAKVQLNTTGGAISYFALSILTVLFGACYYFHNKEYTQENESNVNTLLELFPDEGQTIVSPYIKKTE